MGLYSMKKLRNILLLDIETDCIRTKKKRVFDDLKSLQLLASQGMYSLGCIKNASDKLLTISILTVDMLPRFFIFFSNLLTASTSTEDSESNFCNFSNYNVIQIT